jgi:hypothetical protein
MKIALKITFNNGVQAQADAVFADFVAFERTWNRSVAKLEEELRLTDIAWLAWHSEKRRGKTTEPFDPAWLNLVETVEIAEDETGENPLDSAQSIG